MAQIFASSTSPHPPPLMCSVVRSAWCVCGVAVGVSARRCWCLVALGCCTGTESEALDRQQQCARKQRHAIAAIHLHLVCLFRVTEWCVRCGDEGCVAAAALSAAGEKGRSSQQPAAGQRTETTQSNTISKKCRESESETRQAESVRALAGCVRLLCALCGCVCFEPLCVCIQAAGEQLTYNTHSRLRGGAEYAHRQQCCLRVRRR